jgi:putative ATP-binding cassette transporter
LFQIVSALGNVKEAFDWFLSTYPTIADFRGTVDRLNSFIKAMDIKSESNLVKRLEAPPVEHRGANIIAKGISVKLPASGDNRELWHDADLIVKPGEWVMLTAPEGTGKSCFFRAIAGIWPHSKGSTFFGGNVLFLPQKSYIPQGTLKQAVAYPEIAKSYTDEEVRDALRKVRLKSVLDRPLDDSANWSMVLSGGEQQRLAMAHALLSQPQCLFMDETTSSVGKEGTLELYEMLRSEGTLPPSTSVVTITHKQDLIGSFHDVHYAYKEGKWVKQVTG